MEIHCHITGICEPPMSSSLFSVICSWFSKVLLFLFVTHNKFPKFECNVIDLCIHLRSKYKNRVEFPFNHACFNIHVKYYQLITYVNYGCTCTINVIGLCYVVVCSRLSTRCLKNFCYVSSLITFCYIHEW